MTRATLADVAAAAGVSVATASRAMSGRGDLSAQTRRRVREAATALGYGRHAARGGRPAASAHLIDLVLGRFHNPWADEVTAGAHGAATARGYDLVLTEESDFPGDDWPVRVRRRGSAGVVLGLISPTASQLGAVQKSHIPVVLLDPPSEATHGMPSVRTTDTAGAAAAARHLAARGATRFAVLGGDPPFRYGPAATDSSKSSPAPCRTPTSTRRRARGTLPPRAMRWSRCSGGETRAIASASSRCRTNMRPVSTPRRRHPVRAFPTTCWWWGSTMCAVRAG